MEQGLNAGASNRSFLEKRDYYKQSGIASTRALSNLEVWDAQAIESRTAELTEEFLTAWPRPSVPDQGPEYLVPILDVQKKPGWYKGWRTEFEYVRFQDEIWEVRDLKTMFNRVFRCLWATRRAEVLAHGAAPRGPIFETEEWKGQWDMLGPSRYLFMGMFPQYMLGDMQRILDELDLADEVSVKYSSDESSGDRVRTIKEHARHETSRMVRYLVLL